MRALLALAMLFVAGCATMGGASDDTEPTVIDEVPETPAEAAAPVAEEESKQQEGEVPLAVAETEQTEQAMANVAQLLKEAGAELADVVKIVIYLVDPRYREPVYRVVGRWLKGVHPVSTGVVVTALARPEWLVEIDVTAVIPGAEGGGRGVRTRTED